MVRNNKNMSHQTRVFLTGANGFIGSHILKYLTKKKNYHVTGMVRKTSNLFRLHPGMFNLVYASITEPLREILKGYDMVIHTAGKTSDWGRYDDFYKANVEGTINLIKAACEAGVKRFIHISSTVVYGFKGNKNTSEDGKKCPFPNYYSITKKEAEDRVFNFYNDIELIVLRPSNVFGAFDTMLTYPLIRGIEKGLIGFPGGGKYLTSPCYVKNLVSAIEKSIQTEGGLGEAYNITDGSDIPWKEFLSIIADGVKKKPPPIPIPVKPLYYTSFLLEQMFKLFRCSNPPAITTYRIAQAGKDYSFSIEKAKKYLLYNPPWTTKEGVKESVDWYYDYKKDNFT